MLELDLEREERRRLKAFYNKELDSFLERYVNLEKVKEVASSLTEQEYPFVRRAAREGIENGVSEFLGLGAPPENIYLSNLYEFMFDDSVEKRVLEALRKTNLSIGVEREEALASHVGESYKMFLYNESSDKFLEDLPLIIGKGS